MIERINEYIAKLENDCFTGEVEEDHNNADEILCRLLRVLGYADVVSKYKEVKKWYA